MSKLEKLECEVKLTGEWQNYGDENFLRHGGTFIRKDSGYSYNNGYNIVAIFTDVDENDKELMLMEECFIDPTEEWIDMDGVRSSMDIREGASEESIVVDIFGYYGAYQFSGSSEVKDVEQVVEELRNWGIIE